MKRATRWAHGPPGMLAWALAVSAAALATLGVLAGITPRRVAISLTAATALAYTAFLVGAAWTVRGTPRAVSPWAVALGAASTATEIGGVSFRLTGGPGLLAGTGDVGWVVIHGRGLATIASSGLVLVVHAADPYAVGGPRWRQPGAARGPLARLVAAPALVRSRTARQRAGALDDLPDRIRWHVMNLKCLSLVSLSPEDSMLTKSRRDGDRGRVLGLFGSRRLRDRGDDAPDLPVRTGLEGLSRHGWPADNPSPSPPRPRYSPRVRDRGECPPGKQDP